MKNRSFIALTIVAVSLTVTFATAGMTQTMKKSAAKLSTGAYQSQGFAPGFDDLMTMLVQPRHTKLYYAGAAKNWELAAAESRDLRSSFDRITQSIPKYENNNVGQAMKNFVAPKLDAIDAAIAAANPAKFASTYKDLTVGCNDCHTYMEHPFIVVKMPDATGQAYPDQEFKANR